MPTQANGTLDIEELWILTGQYRARSRASMSSASSPSGPHRATRSSAEARRAQILRAATQVCLDGLTADVSMDAIAAEARVSKGTLYNHFASKEDLLIAMIESRLRFSTELVDLKVGSAIDPRVALERTVEGLLEVIVVQARTASLLYQTWFLVSSDPKLQARFFGALTGFFDQWTEASTRTFAEGRDRGLFSPEWDPSGFADAMTAMVSGFIFRGAFDPKALDPDRLRAAFHALLHQQLYSRTSPTPPNGDAL